MEQWMMKKVHIHKNLSVGYVADVVYLHTVNFICWGKLNKRRENDSEREEKGREVT